MNFKEVLQAVVDEKSIHYLVNVLITLYPDQEDSADGYFAVVLEMLDTEVVPTFPESKIHVTLEDYGDGDPPSPHVYGTQRGYTYLQSYIDNGFDEAEIREKSHPDTLESESKMAIELSPWPEVLGYEFVTSLPLDEALAHALWEMTFFGFSNEAVQERAADILAPISEEELRNAISLEDLEDILDELGEDNGTT